MWVGLIVRTIWSLRVVKQSRGGGASLSSGKRMANSRTRKVRETLGHALANHSQSSILGLVSYDQRRHTRERRCWLEGKKACVKGTCLETFELQRVKLGPVPLS